MVWLYDGVANRLIMSTSYVHLNEICASADSTLWNQYSCRFKRLFWKCRFHTVESTIPGVACRFEGFCGTDDSTLWNRRSQASHVGLKDSVEPKIPQCGIESSSPRILILTRKCNLSLNYLCGIADSALWNRISLYRRSSLNNAYTTLYFVVKNWWTSEKLWFYRVESTENMGNSKNGHLLVLKWVRKAMVTVINDFQPKINFFPRTKLLETCGLKSIILQARVGFFRFLRLHYKFVRNRPLFVELHHNSYPNGRLSVYFFKMGKTVFRWERVNVLYFEKVRPFLVSTVLSTRHVMSSRFMFRLQMWHISAAELRLLWML